MTENNSLKNGRPSQVNPDSLGSQPHNCAKLAPANAKRIGKMVYKRAIPSRIEWSFNDINDAGMVFLRSYTPYMGNSVLSLA